MRLSFASSAPKPGIIDYSMLIVLAAVWGGSFMFIKIAVETIPAATLTLGRLAIAAAILYLIARIIGEKFPTGWCIWGLITICAITGNALPFTLISWGEVKVDSGVAAILMAVMPLTTILLAHIFTDEKLNLAKGLGVIFGILGLVVLIGIDKVSLMGGETIRQLAIALAAASYGLNAIVTKFLLHLPKRSLIAAIMIVSTILMLPVSMIWDHPWTITPDKNAIYSMIILGIAQTAAATLLMFVIVERQGASFFSQINFLVPIFGVIWGILLLKEQITNNAYISLMLIMIGIVIARQGNGLSRTSEK